MSYRDFVFAKVLRTRSPGTMGLIRQKAPADIKFSDGFNLFKECAAPTHAAGVQIEEASTKRLGHQISTAVRFPR